MSRSQRECNQRFVNIGLPLQCPPPRAWFESIASFERDQGFSAARQSGHDWHRIIQIAEVEGALEFSVRFR